jgi:hypothetical protein
MLTATFRTSRSRGGAGVDPFAEALNLFFTPPAVAGHRPFGKPLVDRLCISLYVLIIGKIERPRHFLDVPRAEERSDVCVETRHRPYHLAWLGGTRRTYRWFPRALPSWSLDEGSLRRYSDSAQRSVCSAVRPSGLIKACSVIGSAGSRSSVRAQAGKVETALAASR